MLSYCCISNANRWCINLRSTFSNCHLLFGYLQRFYRCIVATDSTIAQQACNIVHVINRLLYNQPWCKWDHNCDQPTSTTTKVADDTAYYSASALPWKQTTVADGPKCSGINASQPETCPVENAVFTSPAFGDPIRCNPVGISYRSFPS